MNMALKTLPPKEVRKEDRLFLNDNDNIDLIYKFLYLLNFDTKNKIVEYYTDDSVPHINEIMECRSVEVGSLAPFYNSKKKEWDKYKVCLARRMLKKHILSGYRYEPKNFRGCSFIYDLDHKYRKIEDEEKNYLYQKSKAIALPEHPKSYVFAIDIDDHDNTTSHSEKATETLYYILRDFEYMEPLFVEKSCENGGYHLYFRFDERLDYSYLEWYRYNFERRYGLSFDIRSTTQALKLPFAATYETVKITNLRSLKNGETEIPELDYITSYRDAVEDSFTKKEKPLPFRALGKFFLNYDIEPAAKDKKGHTHDIAIPEPFITRRKSFENPQVTKDLSSSFPITSGNRIGGEKNHIKLALACLRNDKSKDEFYDLSISNNVDSRDLEGHNRRRICDELYDWAQKAYEKSGSEISCKTHSPEQFISNIHKLSPEMIEMCENLAAKLVALKGCKYKKSEQIKTFTLFLKEMMGYVIYQHENPRSINPKYHKQYSSKNSSIQHGYQFPRIWAERLKEYYELNCDVHRMFNFIAKSDVIFYQYQHDNLGWRFGSTVAYCRQWLFKRSHPRVVFPNNVIPEDFTDRMIEFLRYSIEVIKDKIFHNYNESYKQLKGYVKSQVSTVLPQVPVNFQPSGFIYKLYIYINIFSNNFAKGVQLE